MNATTQAAERRRRMLTRTLPLIVVAIVAFVAGLVVAQEPAAPAAARFLDAWQRGDTEAMYGELTLAAKDEYSLERFQRAYADATETATVKSVAVDDLADEGDAARAPVTLKTRIFGTLGGELVLPLAKERVDWTPNLVYPGLAADERLVRRTRAPGRAPILAADGTRLARGPAAARTVGTAAVAVVGEVGTASGAQAKDLTARGFPPGTLTGISGLEQAFDERLAGRPGGQLLAVSAAEESSLQGGRVIATSDPLPGKPVRTTIDPDLQEATVAALGATYGGAAVLDAKSGVVRALAGLAYSAPQPPGSTFKVITATGALDAGIVKPSDEFPVESSNSEIGREIPNAHDELCGGSFAESFAESCNTVFAPLGAELGGEKLVQTAERYGFNSPPTLFDDEITAIVDPAMSTIPHDLSESVETGESAIGQGRVLATPLELASISQTVANQGVRMPNAIVHGDLGPDAQPVRVTSEETAATLRELMIGVVDQGTGVAAALPGIQVAGKTGTAELGPAALEPGQDEAEAEQETDAWFTCFAPASKPKLAVAVMVVNSDGDGGTVAAPIARQILASAFGVA
ncbi:MAG TPA: penicillin-binding transpeptidase domain-containing protein [Solirubrobacterales bacterium]|nr:penicillin-binding transpeptidase domain-containing protein [Solirubrobacterales bacterium]